MDLRAGGRRSAESKSHNQRSVVSYGKLSPTPMTAVGASNDRVNMLLMEANEISQYLKKDYVRSLVSCIHYTACWPSVHRVTCVVVSPVCLAVC